MAESGSSGSGDAALRAEFHSQTARIHWHDLQPHYARGAVVTVEEGMDLVEVAIQLRRDNKAQFEAWIAGGQVAGVSDDQARAWYDSNPELWAVVVAPWVLVQAGSAPA
jgi:hypothetical protein